MHRHYAERAAIMAAGFLVATALVMCVAPGDVLLLIVTGLALSIFARGFLEQTTGGDWFWPLARSHRGTGPRTPIGQH